MSLVCWSGGCDSTLVLHSLAAQTHIYAPIRTVSICHPQIGAAKESMRARVRILNWMKSRGYQVQHTELEISHEGEFEASLGQNGSGLHQPSIWISFALSYLRDGEDLYMGYIRTDDIWHYRENLIATFNNIAAMMNKSCRLYFPLEWTEKSEVVRSLRQIGLIDLCWWCEEPEEGSACKKCKPCRTFRKSEALA